MCNKNKLTTALAVVVFIFTSILAVRAADGIEHTIVVMRELQMALGQLAGLVGGSAENLTDKQKEELQSILTPLTSESIREALHKGELPITNGIIRSKNRVLSALGTLGPPITNITLRNGEGAILIKA